MQIRGSDQGGHAPFLDPPPGEFPRHLAEFPFQVPEAGFARVAANDLLEGGVLEAGRVLSESAGLELPRD